MKQIITLFINRVTARLTSLLKPVAACLFILFATAQIVDAQTGYLYVHVKSLSEDINQSFTFSVSGGPTSVSNFSLNDQALNIEPTDIGAGHATGGGELWAVAGATNGVNGPIYRRAPKSAIWSLVSGQTASAIDGADLNHFVMVNTSGDGYVYNGSSFIKIYDHNTYGMTAVDIANNSSIVSGTGVTAIVTSNGHVGKYTGNYSTVHTWTDITPTDNSGGTFTRLDINPTTNAIILIDNNAAVTKINTAGGSLVYYGRSGISPSFATDVAVDEDGVVYDIQHNVAQSYDAVYRYNASGWVPEPQMQQHYVLTCGDDGQAWCLKGYPGAQYSWMSNQSTIFTRTGDGSATWLDDERVQTTQNGNSFLVPVAAGTYTITEANVATWNLQKIDLFDSASGSTKNVAGNKATVVVAAGQVVNVQFTNGLVIPLTVPGTCGITNVIQNFGSGAANTNGGNLTGMTDYHYFNAPALMPNDGYYSLSQNSSVWTNSGLTDHTGLTGGYYMVINASYAPNEFYRQRMKGLIPGATYSFSFWAANLSTTSPLQPNIMAGITDTASGAVLGSTTTGLLPADNNWHQYTFSFVATVATGDLFLQNNALGGSGNDLAIDDISFNQVCTLLPVAQLSFNAQKQNSYAALGWSTANELNFNHFEIERSADGLNWSAIGGIAGKGFNTQLQYYSFTDEHPLNGNNHYRLKLADKDGTFTYSMEKMLQFSNVKWAVSAYPNPVAKGSILTIQSNEALQAIRVFDVTGKLTMVKNISTFAEFSKTSYTLNINSLTEGVYLVQTANFNGEINTIKLITKE